MVLYEYMQMFPPQCEQFQVSIEPTNHLHCSLFGSTQGAVSYNTHELQEFEPVLRLVMMFIHPLSLVLSLSTLLLLSSPAPLIYDHYLDLHQPSLKHSQACKSLESLSPLHKQHLTNLLRRR